MAESYPYHRFAEIFPLLDNAELDKLAENIAAHGLIEPVDLFRGEILDGRNRYRACREIGIEATFRVFTGSEREAFDYVISKNLRRRHMNEAQRAMVSSRIARAGGPRDDAENDPSEPAGTPDAPVMSVEDAAEAMNVSKRSVYRADVVIEQGVPELVAAVDAGSVAVSAAAEVATLGDDEQRAIVEGGPAAITEAARKQRQRQRAADTAPESATETLRYWYLPTKLAEAVVEVMDPAGQLLAIGGLMLADATGEAIMVSPDLRAKPWIGRVLLAPFEKPREFMSKLIAHVEGGSVTEAIAIVPSETEADWFHQSFTAARCAVFLRGRIRWVDQRGAECLKDRGIGHTAFYFGPEGEAWQFIAAFNGLGLAVKV